MMDNKVIYFLIDGRKEQAEFRSDVQSEDVREVFRAAGEAGPCDILRLKNTRGSIIPISGRIPANTPDKRYVLEVICLHPPNGERKKDDPQPEKISKVEKMLLTVKQRLEKLEKAIPGDNEFESPILQELQMKINSLREKLEGMEHLSWVGLSKNINMNSLIPDHPFWQLKVVPTQSTDENKTRIYNKFMSMANVPLRSDVRQQLRRTTFDNWQWDTCEMLILMRQMFIDLGLVFKFNIQMPVLMKWLYRVYTKYNQVPFHNFQHCFMVSQMMYGMIWLIDLPSKLDHLDILTLMVAIICHDLDHPGYNNAYQINARTELALRYNDISPLENHHCAVTFQILESPDCNILQYLTLQQFRQLREGVIRCILATDLSNHNEYLSSFKAITPHFDFSKKDHVSKLMPILIKAADNSNECRPMEVSSLWLDCLLQEFFIQGDLEKLEGLPVTPLRDRDTATKPSSQISFIQFVLLPLFEALAELFPQIDADVVQPARSALTYYRDMQRANNGGQMNTDVPAYPIIKQSRV